MIRKKDYYAESDCVFRHPTQIIMAVAPGLAACCHPVLYCPAFLLCNSYANHHVLSSPVNSTELMYAHITKHYVCNCIHLSYVEVDHVVLIRPGYCLTEKLPLIHPSLEPIAYYSSETMT
jgi:hypothetical protein